VAIQTGFGDEDTDFGLSGSSHVYLTIYGLRET